MKTRVLDLVKAALVAQGYDGLYSADNECTCDTSDLAPCGEMQQDCTGQLGFKSPFNSTLGLPAAEPRRTATRP